MEAQARQSPSQQLWAGLPDHLLDLVLRKQEVGGPNAAAVFRLVCKAWLSAFTDFLGRAQLLISGNQHDYLVGVCKLMPRLSELSIQNFSQQLDLSPLGSCAHLTAFQYDGLYEDTGSHPPGSFDRDLSLLPESLRELQLEAIKLDQGSLSPVKFSGLTKLTCLDTKTGRLWDLLQCLPALQEMHVKADHLHYPFKEHHGQENTSQLHRMSALTLLKISHATLKEKMPATCLEQLQTLKLQFLHVSAACMGSIIQQASRLTFLDLDGCFSTSDDNVQLPVAKLLRRLDLRSSDHKFLQVANPALQSLSSRTWGFNCDLLPVFTALTKLELMDGYLSCSQPRQTEWALQELVAISCTNVHAHFFVPRAFPALKRLHLEKAKRFPSRGPLVDEWQMTVKDLADHPHLHQISGDETFFTAELKSVLATWHRSAFTEQTIECHTTTPHNELTVWTKPAEWLLVR